MGQGPTSTQWREIRQQYESGIPIAQLAKQFGTTRNAIKRHRDAERWTIMDQAVDRMVRDKRSAHPEQIQAAARARIVNLATKQIFEDKGEAIAKSIDDLLREQLSLAAKSQSFVEQIFAKIESGEIQPLPPRETWGSLLSSVVGAAMQSANLTREIAGLKSGQSSVSRKQQALQRRFVVKTSEEAENKPAADEAS